MRQSHRVPDTGQTVTDGGLVVLGAKKPSGTFVWVRLLAPVQFRPDEPARTPDEGPIMCDQRVANYLADNGLGAVITSAPAPAAQVAGGLTK